MAKVELRHLPWNDFHWPNKSFISRSHIFTKINLDGPDPPEESK